MQDFFHQQYHSITPCGSFIATNTPAAARCAIHIPPRICWKCSQSSMEKEQLLCLDFRNLHAIPIPMHFQTNVLAAIHPQLGPGTKGCKWPANWSTCERRSTRPHAAAASAKHPFLTIQRGKNVMIGPWCDVFLPFHADSSFFINQKWFKVQSVATKMLHQNLKNPTSDNKTHRLCWILCSFSLPTITNLQCENKTLTKFLKAHFCASFPY